MLIAYFSQTGNTEKITRAIYDEVISGGHEAELKRVEELDSADLTGYDLVFLGSACHSATLAPSVLDLLSTIPAGTGMKLAGFATHSCSVPDGDVRTQELYERWASGCRHAFEKASEDNRIELLGYFGCQGAASPPIEDFIHSTILPDEDEWQTFITEERKHPDEADLADAGEFAKRILLALK
jgi:flavodoxin